MKVATLTLTKETCLEIDIKQSSPLSVEEADKLFKVIDLEKINPKISFEGIILITFLYRGFDVILSTRRSGYYGIIIGTYRNIRSSRNKEYIRHPTPIAIFSGSCVVTNISIIY